MGCFLFLIRHVTFCQMCLLWIFLSSGGSLFFGHMVCGDLSSREPETLPPPPPAKWKHRVVTTGPPGKSPHFSYFIEIYLMCSVMLVSGPPHRILYLHMFWNEDHSKSGNHASPHRFITASLTVFLTLQLHARDLSVTARLSSAVLCPPSPLPSCSHPFTVCFFGSLSLFTLFCILDSMYEITQKFVFLYLTCFT